MNLKSVLKFLFSRLVIVSLLIMLQVGFLLVVLLKLGTYAGGIFFALQILSMCVVVWIVSKNDNPSYKIAWVIVILTVPLFGGLFYLMWGNKNISKVLKGRILKFYTLTIENMPKNQKNVMDKLKESNINLSTQAGYIERMSGFPVFENTGADYLNLGEAKFEKLKVELLKAKEFIFLEYFIIQEGKMWNPILEILTQKVSEGVEVRVMFDDMGCIQTLPTNYHKTLEKLGIKTTVFNPFKPHINMAMNYRDHRKICVIDGNTGFCGGINLADEYINAYKKHGHWKDTAVVLYGDAVWNLTVMFLTLWNFSNNIMDDDMTKYKPTVKYPSNGYVQPFGDSPLDNFNIAEYAYMQIINRSTDYVYITTPYLIIDNEMITALTIAAQSGIDVRILTPHIADKWFVHILTQAFYSPLVEAGVRIYEYTPGFVHAKMFVSDDNTAIVGTTNMDYRSFYLHFECGVSFYNSTIVYDVKNDFLKTLEVSDEVTLEECKRVGIFTRILRSIIRIFAPMM